jgi:hypothetical protein
LFPIVFAYTYKKRTAKKLDEGKKSASNMYGIPVLVKDVIEVEGFKTTLGSTMLARGNLLPRVFTGPLSVLLSCRDTKTENQMSFQRT